MGVLAVLSLFSLTARNLKLFRNCIADRNGILERAIFKTCQLSSLLCLSSSDFKRVGKVNLAFLKTSQIANKLVIGNKFTVAIEIFTMILPYNEATFWDMTIEILENFWDTIVRNPSCPL